MPPQVLQPTLKTLAKYGLALDDWRALAERQHHVCAICKRLPSSGRLHIDHFHRPGWKKLPPDQRKLDVRGLICFGCNNHRVAKNDLGSAEAVLRYLMAHVDRKAAA